MRPADQYTGSRAPFEGLPQKPWAVDANDIPGQLRSAVTTGLTAAEVAARRRQHGQNQLRAARPRHALSILFDQFRSMVIALLCGAAAVALLFGDHIEGLAVLAVIVINTAIGFFTEWRATRSMEALRQLGHFDTVVRRDGITRRIPAAELVPGDITIFEGGEIVAADVRLLEANGLMADESTLTGESLPVAKHTGLLPESTPLIERANCLYKGTAVTRGSGLGIVTGIGQATELGRIAQLVSKAEAQETPLEKRLDTLGRRLVWVMLGIAGLVALAGILTGRDTVLAIQVAIALTVAAIPEGLPIVATIALARGMWRMARRNALIVRLSAVETLGATGVILTDKTGTLTENRMTVTDLALPGHTVTVGGTGLELSGALLEDESEPEPAVLEMADGLLRAVALCSNASLYCDDALNVEVVGDPTETALLVAAAKRDLWREELVRNFPELREVPFDSEAKLMATFNRLPDGILVSVKGAAESVLQLCATLRTATGDAPIDTGRREAFLSRVQQLGATGLRTLAVASQLVSDVQADPYQNLVLLGVVGLLDPARPGVREAIVECHEAGIEVIMVTGDHAATARTIAEDVCLVDKGAPESQCIVALHGFKAGEDPSHDLAQARIIARASPQQKLELISHYQARGQVVAMTGDGVNDAPALKQADIGIAMGIRGTAVAKEAAAMVLQDDRFATIVEAVKQGRAIYANIRKFVVYLLSCNISEILVVGIATVAGAPLPLLPLQILFLNLVTDVFPALALGVGQGPPGLMQRKPRPAREPILTARHWAQISVYGAVMCVSVLGAMGLARLWLGFPPERAVTVSFCTLAFAQVWHVFNMRERQGHWANNEITRNPWIWAAAVLCVALILGAVHIPSVSSVLELANPGRDGWLLILSMSLLPLMTGPLARLLMPRAARI